MRHFWGSILIEAVLISPAVEAQTTRKVPVGRHADGMVAAWAMDGTSISQAGGFGTISADWTLQGSK